MKKYEKKESISLLNSDEVNRIFINYSVYLPCDYYLHNMNYKFRERIAYSIFNSTKVIQRA